MKSYISGDTKVNGVVLTLKDGQKVLYTAEGKIAEDTLINEILINKNHDSNSMIGLALTILTDLGVDHGLIEKDDHYILKYGK